MKRAKRPGRRIRPWWECGRGFVVFCHPEWGPELRKQYVETELPRFFRGELAMLNDNVTLSNAPGVLVGPIKLRPALELCQTAETEPPGCPAGHLQVGQEAK